MSERMAELTSAIAFAVIGLVICAAALGIATLVCLGVSALLFGY